MTDKFDALLRFTMLIYSQIMCHTSKITRVKSLNHIGVFTINTRENDMCTIYFVLPPLQNICCTHHNQHYIKTTVFCVGIEEE